MRGKSWSVEEERQLYDLVNNGVCVDEIAQIMGKTRLSIRGKMNNLRLTVVVAAARQGNAATTITTTSRGQVDHICEVNANPVQCPDEEDEFAISLRKDEPLPSIEDTLRVLNAALVALQKPGLSRTEITRLNKIIEGVKVYQERYAGFVKYDAIEKEVLELKKQFANQKNLS